VDEGTAVIIAAVITAVVGPLVLWRITHGPKPPKEDNNEEEVEDGYIIYIVKERDTLGKIARTHNTTVDVLVRINNIPDPDFIFPGEKLRIPQGSPPPRGT
jgi:LysM repeat protein